MARVLQAIGIDKWRGKHRVLTDINFHVCSGELLTILGPNGAGKSTLMAILAGLWRPDAGSVQLGGIGLTQLGTRAHARVGVALQQRGLSARLTVREILHFFSLCYNGNGLVADLLQRFRLEALQHCQTRRLSEGQKQRVALALAFLKAFDVILLDEPMAGIDPEGRRVIWDEIRQMRERGTAVVCATHLTDEAQHESDRVLVLHHGHQLAFDRPHRLLQNVPGREKVEMTDGNDVWRDTIEKLPGITAVLRNGPTVTLYCHRAGPVMQALLAQDDIPNISCGLVSLEDSFRMLVHGKARACK